MKRSEFFEGCKTIKQIIESLKEAASELPGGLDTPVCAGDFEGNYMQGPSIEIQVDKNLDCAFIGYEMHEDLSENISYNEDDEVEFDPE